VLDYKWSSGEKNKNKTVRKKQKEEEDRKCIKQTEQQYSFQLCVE